jgi:hypothetical protein
MFNKSFIIAAVVTIAASIASAIPVYDDLWDASQGAMVTATSGAENSASNMFGTNEGGLDVGATIFYDWIGYGYLPYPIGTEHWVEWQTADIVSLGSFKLYAAHDGGSNARSFDHFSLLAKDPDSGVWNEIYGTDVAVPYTYINGEEGFLIEHTFSAAVTAQEFKASFRQHTAIFWASGPRVIELDGFTEIPEPATICMLGLGALSLIRRKK